MPDESTPLAQRLVEAVASVLPEAYDRSCGLPPDVIANGSSSASEEWVVEARVAVAAVLREIDTDDTAAELRLLAAHRAALCALADSIERAGTRGE